MTMKDIDLQHLIESSGVYVELWSPHGLYEKYISCSYITRLFPFFMELEVFETPYHSG